MSFLWTLNSTPSLESKITSASRELKGSLAGVVEVEATLCEYASMVLDRGGRSTWARGGDTALLSEYVPSGGPRERREGHN